MALREWFQVLCMRMYFWVAPKKRKPQHEVLRAHYGDCPFDDIRGPRGLAGDDFQDIAELERYRWSG